ncbi:LysR family transcriptional regulator [Cellulomonas sp. ACRRI]|uniref:LysR family transcriptional regulator n=1 Tax=Cellulomonas sp. ACRRI TaxID=2918188 RepID=UPI001EF3026E|nr:LysR family transcriptional regulator [Cellulomonas sp. ACRRI]MCG7284462.1 LysR family transcriptional regulator [Cellulomonas sp. ACRRI]
MAAHDLEHVRTFVTAYRTGSVSDAARLLGISQPTASAHVRALESRLGYALFDRTPTGVVATARATVLAQQAIRHLDALDDLVELSGEAGTVLHVGGAAEVVGEVLAPHVPELVAAAGAPVRLHLGVADDLLEQLRVGELDIVLSSVRPRVQGLSGSPVTDEEFVLVGAPRWERELAGSQAAVDALERIPVVAYAENLPIIRRYWRSVFGRRPDIATTAAVVPDLRAVRAAVVGGAGMSVLPRYLVGEQLAAGALVELHRPEVAPLNTLYLVTRSGRAEASRSVRDLAAVIARITAAGV